MQYQNNFEITVDEMFEIIDEILHKPIDYIALTKFFFNFGLVKKQKSIFY